jgi:hypothetical protein
MAPPALPAPAGKGKAASVLDKVSVGSARSSAGGRLRASCARANPPAAARPRRRRQRRSPPPKPDAPQANAWVSAHGTTVLLYGWIPAVIALGMLTTKPRPSVLQLIWFG